MEHDLLDGKAGISRENVLQTYLTLATGLPGTEVIQRDGFLRVLGTWPLSFCNFAGQFESDRDPDDVARELVGESRRGDGLWAFVMSGDRPAELRNSLLDHGFSLRQCLTQFWSADEGEPMPEIRLAQDADSRLRVGSFMADQFFPFSSANSKSMVARSTAMCLAELAFIGSAERPDAAMMLCRTKYSVGLYNLCVRKGMRNQGLGTKLVRAAQSIAASYKLPLTLQCHASLRKWYQDQAFEMSGTVHAFYCGKAGSTDIM